MKTLYGRENECCETLKTLTRTTSGYCMSKYSKAVQCLVNLSFIHNQGKTTEIIEFNFHLTCDGIDHLQEVMVMSQCLLQNHGVTNTVGKAKLEIPCLKTSCLVPNGRRPLTLRNQAVSHQAMETP